MLVDAKFSYQAALIGMMTVVNYTLGFTFEEQADPRRDDDLEHFRALITAHQVPHVRAAFDENVTPPDPDAEFEASLRLIIAGLAQNQGRG